MIIKTFSKKVIGKNPDNEDICVYCGRLLRSEYNSEFNKIEYSCICQYFYNHCQMNMELAITNIDFERSMKDDFEYQLYKDSYWCSFNEYQMKDRLIQIDDDYKIISIKGGK